VGVDWNGLHRGAHSSASSGRPTAGTTAVATPITSPFGRRCAIVSLEYVSSGSPTDLARDDTTGRGVTHRVRGRAQPISRKPPAPNARQTSGEHVAALSSLNTTLAQSVDTAATSATSATVTGTTWRRSPASRASTSPGVTSRPVFRAPREGEGSFESSQR